LCGLKGNGGFGGALRTNCPGFCPHATAGSGNTLDFALFATLWIVLELLIVKEQLFAGGKDKVVTAIRTFQYLVDEVHYTSPRACLGIFQYSVDKGRIGIVSPTSYFVCNSTTFLAFAKPGNERGNGAKPLRILEEYGIAGLTYQWINNVKPAFAGLVLLFSCLLTIPLARQCFFYSTALARFQVKRVTLHFLNNVFLLNLALKPAQCIFKRLAFLHANLCQMNHTSKHPNWVL